MSNVSSNCPRCGTPLPQDAPHGLCPRCLGALNLETQTAPGGEPGRDVPPLSPEELAPLFPQLEIVRFIGKGGMGAVYLARQKELQRPVALKILPPEVVEKEGFTQRFTREARALARLSHPGIVTLYEFGQVQAPGRGMERRSAEGTPYQGAPYPLYFFLMEYVDGVNLRELLKTGRVSPREALAIVPQICDALQYAHDMGIVHRDIKPENILVDRRSRVKVADFGLAKLIAAGEETPSGATASGESGTLTSAGATMGTPAYMAPEQREHPNDVDHRADIYALGVVFYEMLTGELPGQKFQPPSRRVRVDVRLDDIVLQALERSPERRYQHVSEIKTAVHTVTHTPPPVPQLQAPAAPAQAPRARSNFLPVTVGVFLIFLMILISIPVLAILAAIGLPAIAKERRNSSQRQETLLQARNAIPGSMAAMATSAGPGGPAAPELLSGEWTHLEEAPISGRSSCGTVWTGTELIVFGGEGLNVSFGDGAIYNAQERQWRGLPMNGAAPGARTTFSTVWTGKEMIVWGGFGGSFGRNVVHDDGGIFSPESNTWRPVAPEKAPAARFNHTAVWTGKDMIIWGGYTDSHGWYAGGTKPGHLNDGGCYNLLANQWRPVSVKGAPAKRFNHTAVWTGKEMLVWGGSDGSRSFNDGALYDPVRNSWRPVTQNGAPSPRGFHAAVWTGKEMIVWGGAPRDSREYLQDGGRYDPEVDLWRPISIEGAPKGRVFLQALWTGRQLFVWGGVNDAESFSTTDPQRYVGTGGLYDPETDTWTEISSVDAPSARLTSAVWTGESVLVFGGYGGVHLNDLFEFR